MLLSCSKWGETGQHYTFPFAVRPTSSHKFFRLRVTDFITQNFFPTRIRNSAGMSKSVSLLTAIFGPLAIAFLCACAISAQVQTASLKNSNILSVLNDFEPPPRMPLSAKAIIAAFLKSEAETRDALNQHTFKRDVVLQTIGPNGAVTGEYIRNSQFLFDDRGNRIERVSYHPSSTIRDLRVIKVKGIVEPQGKQRFPIFETWRGAVTDALVFPNLTTADQILRFPNRYVHYRINVKYYNYKRFASKVTVTEIDPSASE